MRSDSMDRYDQAKGEEKEMKSLFTGEENFWLTKALATGIAREVLSGAELPDMQSLAAERFTEHIRPGIQDAQAGEKARRGSLENLEEIKSWLDRYDEFEPEGAFILNEAFTAYWIFSTLIELEWQKVLGEEAMTEIYEFLDGSIAERAEIESIAEAYEEGRELSEDELLYLRTHWTSSHNFFIRMRHDFRRLSDGTLNFVSQTKEP